MLCYRCKEYNLILNLENYILCNRPDLYRDFNQLIDEFYFLNEKERICNNCKSTILINEPYLENFENFSSKVLKIISKEIMRNIVCCTECGDGADIKGLYPSIKSCFYDEDDNPDEIFNEIDTAIELNDLMYEILENKNDSWEPYYKKIVKYIECPQCDNGTGIDWSSHIDHGTFDMYTEVYTQKRIDSFNRNFYGDSVSKINNEISEIAKKFTFDELLELKKKYVNNKIFIYKDNEFKKLYDLIKNSCIVYILGSKRIIFKARPNKVDNYFTTDEMWEAPNHSVGQGRYNDNGESVLYCANNNEVVKEEVIIDSGIHNVGTFRVLNPLVLLPVNYLFGKEYNGFISEEVKADSINYKLKEQYIITNIVSAIAKDIGYNGIVFISAKDYFSVNYALFKYEKNKDLECLFVN